MDYVILLDDYQGQQGADQYAVTFCGTRTECAAQTHHDGGTAPFAKSDYAAVHVADKSLIGPSGQADDGEIARLEPRREAAADPAAETQALAARRPSRRKPIAGRAGRGS